MSGKNAIRNPVTMIDDQIKRTLDQAIQPITKKISRPVSNMIQKLQGKIDSTPSMDKVFEGVECPMEDGKKVVIRVRGLYKVFGSKERHGLKLLKEGMGKQDILEKTGISVGLDDVSFDVYEGETFVLMGLSGSGKSTLERCLNRLIKPTQGMVSIEGLDITQLSKDQLRMVRRSKMGMVFQSFALLPHKTVLDNVAYGLDIQGIEENERRLRSEQAIEMVGLSGYVDSLPAELSGGMKQRVGLARALASDPDILLMDEAFSALDPLIRNDMQDELIELQERLSKTIVFVTHDLDEALKLGDRIALMNHGKIVQIGTAEDILKNPANEYVDRFVKEVDRTKVLTAASVMRPPEAVVYLSQGPRTALALMEKSDRSSIFVVNKGKKLMGIIESDDVLTAAQMDMPLSELYNECPSVSEETQINEIIPLLIHHKHPIPVVNIEGKLIGVVRPAAALKILDGGQ